MALVLKSLPYKHLRVRIVAAVALSPYGLTTYDAFAQQISCQTIAQIIILFGMKLYFKILQLFSGQLKSGVYNTDIRVREEKKKREKK